MIFVLLLPAFFSGALALTGVFNIPPVPSSCGRAWNISVTRALWRGALIALELPTRDFDPQFPGGSSGDKKFFVFKDGPRRFPYMLGIGELRYTSRQQVYDRYSNGYRNIPSGPKTPPHEIMANASLSAYLLQRLASCALSATNAAWSEPDNAMLTLSALRKNVDPKRPRIPPECLSEGHLNITDAFTRGLLDVRGIPQSQAYQRGNRPAYVSAIAKRDDPEDNYGFPKNVTVHYQGQDLVVDAAEALEGFVHSRVMSCAIAVFRDMERLSRALEGEGRYVLAYQFSDQPSSNCSACPELLAVLILLILGAVTCVVAWAVTSKYRAAAAAALQGSQGSSRTMTLRERLEAPGGEDREHAMANEQ